MKLSGDIFGLHFNIYFSREPENEKLHPDETLPEEQPMQDSGVTSSTLMQTNTVDDPRNFGFFYNYPFVPKSPV